MTPTETMIHPSAIVAPDAVIGRNVAIGAGSVIRSGVTIGDHAVIQEHCLIGLPGVAGGPALAIPAHSTVRSHTVIYCGSTFGERLETGHHVVIRERTVAGLNLRVGNFCDIEGDCEIGDYCRLHGYVHVGKGTQLGHFVWLFSLSTMTNDPLPPSLVHVPVNLDDGVVVCVGATLMPGVVVGKGAFICAGALAGGTIPAGAVVSGPDGRIINHVGRLMHLPSGIRHPWMRHYRKNYPPEAEERLARLEQEILANRLTLQLDSNP